MDTPAVVVIAARPPDRRDVFVEAPLGWGPGRALCAALERLGYRVDDERLIGVGERRLRLR